MIGQVQLMGCGDFGKVREALEEHKGEILDLANSRSRTLSSMKAGARDVEIRKINDPEGSIVLHLKVDVRDAMGANVVNSMCEAVAPFLESITGCKTNLRILSNLTPDRIARSKAKFRKDLIGGEEVVKRIIRSYEM